MVRQRPLYVLRLVLVGLDDKKDDDKSVSSPDKPGYDEVNDKEVSDNLDVKKVDDDVNEDDDD